MRYLRFAPLLAILFIAQSASAQQPPLYSVDSAGGGMIYEINPFTGASTALFATPVPTHTPGGTGPGPEGLAYSGTHLYFVSGNVSETGGTYTAAHNRTIYKLDPATGATVDQLELTAPAGATSNLDHAIDALATDGTTLWANRPFDNTIVEIRLSDFKEKSSITLTGINNQGGLGYNTYDGYLYVSEGAPSKDVHRLNSATGALVSTITMPSDGILGVDFVHNKLFVNQPPHIVEISPFDGREINRFMAPGTLLSALAGGPAPSWTCRTDVLYSVNSERSSISVIDPNTGAFLHEFLAPVAANPPGAPPSFGGPEALSHDGGKLNYLSGDHPTKSDTVYKVDECTGAILDATVPPWPTVPAGTDPTIDALANGTYGGVDMLFALRPATNEVYHFDRSTGLLAGTTTLTVNGIGGLGFSNARQTLFVSDFNASPDVLYEINPASGAPIATHVMPADDVLGVDLVGERLFVSYNKIPGEIQELTFAGTAAAAAFPAPDHQPSALAGRPSVPPSAPTGTVGHAPLFSVDSDTDLIYELDPYTGAVVRSFPTPVPSHVPGGGAPDGLAYDGTTLYYTSGNASETGMGYSGLTNRTIFYIDPNTGFVFDTMALPAAASPGDMNQAIDALASDGTFLYANRPADGIIYKINPASKIWSAIPLSGVQKVGGMGYNVHDGYLYISDSTTDTVHRIDPGTGASLGTWNYTPDGGILGIDFVFNKMFVSLHGSPTEILEVSPLSGAVINRIPAPGMRTAALAGPPGSSSTCVADLLYTVDSDDSMITAIDPNTGAVARRFLAPVATVPPGTPTTLGGPEGLAFDGSDLYYISGDHPVFAYTVFRVEACTGGIVDMIAVSWPTAPAGVDDTVDALAYGEWGGNNTLFGLRPATNEIFAIDPTTGSVGSTITLGGMAIGGMGFSTPEQSLFVSDFNASPNVIHEVDPGSGSIINTFNSSGSDVLGVDFFENRLFVATDDGSGLIEELDLSGSVLNSFPAPDFMPSALAGPPGQPPAPAFITFEVNLNALILAGMFDENNDEVQVRGPFNGWNCTDPSCVLAGTGDGFYEGTVPVSAHPGDTVPYKFFVDLDPARFGGTPPEGWEEPYVTGGANRSFTFTGADLDVPGSPFADLVPGNVIPTGTTTNVTFRLDMNGAAGFSPGSHEVFVNLAQEVFWAVSQGFNQNERRELIDPDGDGIYEVILPVGGPTTSGIQFTYGFGTDLNNPVVEEMGGDFDTPGRKRSRWITPDAGGWPTDFVMPVDTFQPTGPLPVEDNPARLVAVDDAFTTPEDTPITIRVLDNDIDPSGVGLEIDDVTDPAAGATLSDAGNGGILVTPDADFNGDIVFTYTVEDNAGQTDDATVTVTVTAVNDAPRAAPDQAETIKGTPVEIRPLANDADVDGDALTVVSISTPASGTATLASNVVTFDPGTSFVGNVSFEYVVSDGQATKRGAIQVTVLDANLTPDAVDDSASTDEDTPVTIDVLGNDSDPDNDALTITTISTPGNGTAAAATAGGILYTPNPDFSGTDTFTYTIADPQGLNDTATVTVTVTAVNDPPVAVPDVRRAFEGATADYDVLANDTDPDVGDRIRLLSVTAGTLGTVEVKAGKVRYTPNAGATGSEVLTYTISDGTNTVTGTLTISIVPLPPDDDGIEDAVEGGHPNNGDGNNDGVPDNEQANVASFPSATSGQYLSVASETGSELVGVVSSATPPATPPAGIDFPAGFLDFQVRGGTGNEASTLTIYLEQGTTANAYYKYGPTPDNPTPHWYNFLYDGRTGAVIVGNEITLHFVDGERGDDDLTKDGVITDPGAPAVTPNKVPSAQPDASTIAEDNGVTINVLENDSDGDGDTLSILQVTEPSNGTATIVNGTVQYTPDENFFGEDSFSYLVSDGNGGTTSTTVTVTVTAVNDAPVAVEDAFTTEEDAPIILSTLLQNDFDVENSALSLGLVFAADKGLVSRNTDGTITYTPPAEFSGTDTFTYTVSDGEAESQPGRVTITVTDVNDAPVAGADAASLEVGQTSITVDVLSNDTDVDSQTLTVTDVSGATHGTVTIQQDGTVLYEPGPTFQNSDTFTYTLSDGEGGTSTGTVTIALGAAAPIAEADEGNVDEDGSVLVQVLANDTDPNGDTLTVISVTDPPNGTASIDADGNVVYTPDEDFFGTDTFTYEVSDGGIITAATVTVTINPVNDAPRFTPGASVFTFPQDGSSVFVGGDTFENPIDGGEQFLVDFAGAVDVEGDAITYKWVLGTDEDVTEPILTTDTDETELTFLVSEIAEVLDGAGATAGAGTTVYHRIIASDGDLETASAVSSFTLIRGFVTSIEDEAIPEEFELHQNYPNPFNPVTRIRFGLPASESVEIVVYDATGRLIANLVDATMPAGYHEVTMDAVGLPSGVYLYVMKAGNFRQTKSFVLLR
ncbi:MAG: tandem-95 repeat protein [Rhodothermales bacterium]|nr:tandem-95 repeat protein [Rhodothermales bacterium]